MNPSRLDLGAVNLIILSTALTEILGGSVYCVNPEYPLLEWRFFTCLDSATSDEI